MRRNEQDIREEEPILPDGWREGDALFPASGGNGYDENAGNEYAGNGNAGNEYAGNEEREEDAYGDNRRGGAGAADRGEPAERGGDAPAYLGSGGRPARVRQDGGAGEYPAGLDRDSDREFDRAAQRRMGRGDILPGGDGERETLTDDAGRSTEERDGSLFGNGGPDSGGNAENAGNDGFSSTHAQLRLKAQAARLLYPELRDLPDEDAVAVVLGGGMLGAYAGFRAREAARLRQENETLRRNRDASRRAPVRGVSRGGPAPRGQDLFEQGFDQDGW